MAEVSHSEYNFPLERTCPFTPPPEYRKIREEEPITKVVLPNGNRAWVVTRHTDVRQVLNDHRFSADREHPAFPHLLEGAFGRGPDAEKSMISMDGPEHTTARRLVVGEFTVRRLEGLRPRIQAIVDECVDAILAGPKPVDLVPALALPVPSLVICELLGIPYADHDFFQRNSAKILLRGGPPEERRAAFDALGRYMNELIAKKEVDPGDDLLSRQIAKRRENGVHRRPALAELGFLLLVAGHETTANMISLGTAGLLKHPDQLAVILADPSKTPGAVEELLRFFTIVDTAQARLCVEDAEIGGVTIRAGEGVLALGYAANRDPEVFEDPDSLDVERGARHHVAFGFGPHQCLGQHLARMELQIVFDTLFRRIPTLRLAVRIEDLPTKNDAAVFGLHRLPVTW
ncbi:cytochrome P450 [Rhizohabitans arisaemae]|uniref:cytochrome P450 n=1 Tax=Rhizohabitans arisaemae TaxID=2720610 RepID=UPI0024B0C802|nr:cytochrome P450 [Rhizohabitans arisaemae]